jgi:hypothetical protein
MGPKAMTDMGVVMLEMASWEVTGATKILFSAKIIITRATEVQEMTTETKILKVSEIKTCNWVAVAAMTRFLRVLLKLKGNQATVAGTRATLGMGAVRTCRGLVSMVKGLILVAMQATEVAHKGSMGKKTKASVHPETRQMPKVEVRIITHSVQALVETTIMMGRMRGIAGAKVATRTTTRTAEETKANLRVITTPIMLIDVVATIVIRVPRGKVTTP